MSKKITHSVLNMLFAVCCLLPVLITQAQESQPYEWQWAMSGGGSAGGTEVIKQIII